ncbi:MAG: response regulator [Mucilaginibacter polytrichastri]|nr:response regulator [Mucilaginibacter polytrichastri]
MEYGILYVDDEVHNLNSFKASFRRDFSVYVAQSAKEARKILDEHEIAVIVSDQRMPVTTGIEFLESIIPVYPDTIRMLMTGFSDIGAVMDAINRGQVYKYLVKPWQDDELRMHLENAIEIYRLRRDNRELVNKLAQANQQLNSLSKNSE